jgi:NaMN:DMB phosphoribosyltransferase
MKAGKFLIALAAVLIAGGTMAAAAANPSSANDKATTHHLMGTVDSVNGTSLVVTHNYKGKSEDSNFVLNSATIKDGTLSKGEQATVYYQIDNKQNVATEVKVNQTKKS